MWVIVFNAVDDFGIKEYNDAARMSSMPNISPIPSIESVKQKILDEALHGALRIAGLVMPPFFFSISLTMPTRDTDVMLPFKTGVLTSNGYLVSALRAAKVLASSLTDPCLSRNSIRLLCTSAA